MQPLKLNLWRSDFIGMMQQLERMRARLADIGLPGCRIELCDLVLLSWAERPALRTARQTWSKRSAQRAYVYPMPVPVARAFWDALRMSGLHTDHEHLFYGRLTQALVDANLVSLPRLYLHSLQPETVIVHAGQEETEPNQTSYVESITRGYVD